MGFDVGNIMLVAVLSQLFELTLVGLKISLEDGELLVASKSINLGSIVMSYFGNERSCIDHFKI